VAACRSYGIVRPTAILQATTGPIMTMQLPRPALERQRRAAARQRTDHLPATSTSLSGSTITPTSPVRRRRSARPVPRGRGAVTNLATTTTDPTAGVGAKAFALVADPRILIFDEATSALDYESERAIQQSMKQIAAGQTVFIIAHRLSTVRTADRINHLGGRPRR
jgi:hypothetical protein